MWIDGDMIIRKNYFVIFCTSIVTRQIWCHCWQLNSFHQSVAPLFLHCTMKFIDIALARSLLQKKCNIYYLTLQIPVESHKKYFVALRRLNPDCCAQLQLEVAQDPHNQSIVDQTYCKHHSFNSCACDDGDHLSMRYNICGPIIGKSGKLSLGFDRAFSDPSTRKKPSLPVEPSEQHHPNPSR